MQISSDTPEYDLAQPARWRAALEASGDVIYYWDMATDLLEWCGPASRLFGGSDADPPSSGEALHRRINPEDLPARKGALSGHLARGGRYDCEFRVRGRDGQFQWVHDRGAVEVSQTGVPSRMIGILRLVTQRKQQEARLEYLASFDELTGHLNKVRLREALDQALTRNQRAEQTGAFLVIGLDQLGRINTAYGYQAGDAILFEISQRLDGCLRASDIVGRLGSDRFGIVLSHCDEDAATQAAERILLSVRRAPIEIGGSQVHVTASAGAVIFPKQSNTSFDVIAKAEGALLSAKEAGRDCMSFYEMSEQQRQSHRTNLDVGEQVKQALKDDRLVLAYQPVVDAADGQVRYHECLLRMVMPDGELVTAARFVPVVEQLGLMRTIDRRVLDLAIRELRAYPEVSLAINISGLTAADRSWLRALVTRVGKRPDLAERLIVEITETAALHDIEDSARFVAAVRELGCQVAIDDFGAGYTTFRHLRALTADVVKIDGSFVKNINDSSENQLFVRNLLSLARSFGLATVAECVENAEEAAYLAAEGIDLLQGYYFGKPLVTPAWRVAKPHDQGAHRARATTADWLAAG